MCACVSMCATHLLKKVGKIKYHLKSDNPVIHIVRSHCAASSRPTMRGALRFTSNYESVGFVSWLIDICILHHCVILYSVMDDMSSQAAPLVLIEFSWSPI